MNRIGEVEKILDNHDYENEHANFKDKNSVKLRQETARQINRLYEPQPELESDPEFIGEELLKEASQPDQSSRLLKGEQTCKKCGVADGLNFTVSDEDWECIVVPELQTKVLCLKCFDEMAEGKPYTVTEIYFAGQKQGLKFLPEARIEALIEEIQVKVMDKEGTRRAGMNWDIIKATHCKGLNDKEGKGGTVNEKDRGRNQATRQNAPNARRLPD